MEQDRTSIVLLHLIQLAGRAITGLRTIVNLIAETTTAKGLAVTCRLDRHKYPTGRKVTVEEMEQVNLYPGKFHGEWNYVIKPHALDCRK